MAGLGCCIDTGTFGDKDRGKGLNMTKGGDEKETNCKPNFNPENLNLLAFGDPDPWPKWMYGPTCSIISILMHDEMKFGQAGNSHLSPVSPPLQGEIFTPENALWMAKCIKKCSGGVDDLEGGGGLGFDKKSHDCWMKCKQELMEQKFGRSIDPSFVKLPDGPYETSAGFSGYPEINKKLCPPLCVEVEVVLSIRMLFRFYDPNKLVPWDHYAGHLVRGAVTSCEKGKKVCFTVQDYHPQDVDVGEICVGPDGKWLDGVPNGYGEKIYDDPAKSGTGILGGKVYRKGECKKLMRRGQKGSICVEYIPEGSYISGVYLEDPEVKC